MEIISNGSRFAGESPTNLNALIRLIELEPLTFPLTRYGWNTNMFTNGSFFSASGNFVRVSHAFQIEGTPEELEELCEAIKRNRTRVQRGDWDLNADIAPGAWECMNEGRNN